MEEDCLQSICLRPNAVILIHWAAVWCGFFWGGRSHAPYCIVLGAENCGAKAMPGLRRGSCRENALLIGRRACTVMFAEVCAISPLFHATWECPISPLFSCHRDTAARALTFRAENNVGRSRCLHIPGYTSHACSAWWF